MIQKPEPRRRERARLKRVEVRVQTQARGVVFREDERCRFPYESTQVHPCAGSDELCHMSPRTKAQTRGREPAYRHNPTHLMRFCAEHHHGTYSLDGSVGGKGFTVVPLTDQLHRGPCRFVDRHTGEVLGVN